MENHSSSIAIVTGAGSGIGRDTAIQLAEHGIKCAIVSRTESNLEETAVLMKQSSPNPDDCNPLILPLDLSLDDTPRQAAEQTHKHFDNIDILINCAGSAPMMSIDKITPETWHDCIDINLSATVLLTQAVWSHFVSRQTGLIINISSMASVDPFPGFSIYAAAKVGVNMFTHAAAAEGKKHGIRAVAIAPGAVETDMLRANFPIEMIPTEKTLDPADVATKILTCVNDPDSYTSGETILFNSP
ncbi:SDR family NAD(P)-dependent oxidoreductase [Poriferisphaera sp. WC338]|uniref:SDR family NAD(P)-dependent oxidoreductase n=1 Tax=Poriferisphaera sp. WC338 TaxID=3425129 RepID=UPI003D816A75